MAKVSSGVISAVDAGQGHNWEPYRAYNFELEIEVAGKEQLLLSVDVGALPSMSFDEIELNYGNDSIFVEGKAHVDQMSITFKDFADPNTAQVLLAWRKEHYDPKTGLMGLAAQYKKKANLRQYLPNEQFMRTWQLLGLWMPTLNMGSLDQGQSDFVRVEASFRYDRAIPGAGF